MKEFVSKALSEAIEPYRVWLEEVKEASVKPSVYEKMYR
jgi:hypothetical protein